MSNCIELYIILKLRVSFFGGFVMQGHIYKKIIYIYIYIYIYLFIYQV